MLDVQHPASARLLGATLTAGRTVTENYLDTIAAVGVRLPMELTVISDEPLAVRHRWVFGPGLLNAVESVPELFVNSVREIGRWVCDLAATDARIDTNLANFCVVEGRPVLVDVLPPLIPSLRQQPTNLFEVLFAALCFDTEIILAALVGYAARALLRAADPAAARQFVAVGRDLSPPVSGYPDGPLAEVWFRSRATLALRALAGELPADPVRSFFVLTSVRAFRELDEQRRARRVEQVREALRGLGVR
ncbi:hypothetical protein [Gandjariella thermophila]|uniref:hypothetical protein n=1 Tax=Gandjariella thermophila TaxID=1931992 RepID=UPI003530A3FF